MLFGEEVPLFFFLILGEEVLITILNAKVMARGPTDVAPTQLNSIHES